jgi:hypothetical protein|nr:MAG TPA: hypothetical protein [Caudoviricetes sp.]
MKITKEILDKKIKDYEIEANHDLTFREWIEMLEDEFQIEHRDLDNMADDELDNYDTFLFELSLK